MKDEINLMGQDRYIMFFLYKFSILSSHPYKKILFPPTFFIYHLQVSCGFQLVNYIISNDDKISPW